MFIPCILLYAPLILSASIARDIKGRIDLFLFLLCNICANNYALTLDIRCQLILKDSVAYAFVKNFPLMAFLN